MKIGLFVPSWPPGGVANGIVTYAGYLVPALRRLGHQVYVLTNNPTRGYEDPWIVDLRNFSAGARIWNRLMFKVSPAAARFNSTSATIVAAVRELVKNEKLDVLEMEESYGWSFAVSQLKILPVVVRLHGPWFVNGIGDPNFESALNRRREKWEGRGIRNAQIVTSPSANVIQAVKHHYGAGSIIESNVIPNLISVEPEDSAWNLATCCKDTLLFVGRMDKRKGADIVLRSFVDLAQRHPRLKLTLVGPDTGIKEGGGTALSYEEYVDANIPAPIRTRIEYLGSLKHSDLIPLRRKSFATVIASRFEVMPYSVLEAMSLGCPLIATSVGGIPEMITDRQNGLLVPPEDLAAFTDACDMLLGDAKLAARLGRQAWRDCRRIYNPDTIAKHTIATYGQAIDRFRRSMPVH